MVDSGRQWWSTVVDSDILRRVMRDSSANRSATVQRRIAADEDVDTLLPLAGLIVIVPVVVRVVFRGGAALTGRVGRHSTAGLAMVAAACLAFTQLHEGVGRRHPQLGREGGVVCGPVGEHGLRA
jgi:hypothetical protein